MVMGKLPIFHCGISDADKLGCRKGMKTCKGDLPRSKAWVGSPVTPGRENAGKQPFRPALKPSRVGRPGVLDKGAGARAPYRLSIGGPGAQYF